MSIQRHPDISGSLSLTVPGAGSGGRTFNDVREFSNYGGRFTPLGDPPLVGGDGTDEGDLWSLVTLPSPGMSVDIAFYYNSHSHSNGPFGFRRTCSLHLYARGAGTPIADGTFTGHLPIVMLTRGNDSTTTYKFDAATQEFVCQTPELLNKLVLVLTGTEDLPYPLWVESTPDGRAMAYEATTNGSFSPVLAVKDAVGNQHTFDYDSDGFLQTVTDQVERAVTFAYNGLNLLHTVEDWAGRVTTFQYDTNANPNEPRLTQVTDAAGNDTQYWYDGKGRICKVQDAEGYRTTYSYDTAGKVTGRTLINLSEARATTTYDYIASLESGTTLSYASIKVTDAHSYTFLHTENEDFRLIRWESPKNQVLTYIYNVRGQETQRIDQHGGIWETLYDGHHFPYVLQDAAGRKTTIVYDDFANPLAVTRPAMGTQHMLWIDTSSPNTLTHDATGEKRLLREDMDEVGNTTKYGYTNSFMLGSISDAKNHVSGRTYDDLGNLSYTNDWPGYFTYFQHDLAGNVIQVQNADDQIWTYTYDTGDRVLSELNPLSQSTINTYDKLGNLKVSEDFRGNLTTYTYNIFDALVQTLDPTNRFIAARYDELGLQTASIDGLGKATTTSYDPLRRPNQITNPEGRIVTTVYDQIYHMGDHDYPAQQNIDEWGNTSGTVFDAIGRVIRSVDELGHFTDNFYEVNPNPTSGTFTYSGSVEYVNEQIHTYTTTYDLAGRAVGSVDYLGSQTTTVYDELDRVVQSIDPLGRITTIEYDIRSLGEFGDDFLRTQTTDPKSQLSTVTYDTLFRPFLQSDVASNVTSTAYDALGRPLTVTDPIPLGSTAPLKITTFEYDLGNAAHPADAVIDPAGNRATSIYDAAGRLVASVDALGHATTTAYDLAGRPEYLTDPLTHITQTFYDKAGRVVAVMDPLGNRVTTVYDQKYPAAPYLNFPTVATIDERSKRTTQIFDSAGRQVATQDAEGKFWKTSYDNVNRTVSVTDPLNKTTVTTYDLKQDDLNAIAITDALGQVSTSVYDLAGQLVRSIDVLGNSTTYQYDPLGRRIAVQDARAFCTTTSYDDVNQRTAVLDANSGITTNVYDSRGLLIQDVDPLTRVATYLYNDAGYLIQRKDRNAVEIDYTPDPLGRTHVINYADSKTVTYTYDAAYRQTNMQDWTGNTSYGYDNADQLTALNHSNHKNLQYTPDAAGNRVVLKDPDGALTAYSYDNVNRLTTIANPFGETTVHTYYDNGWLHTRAFANGVVETRTYDDIGRLETLKSVKDTTTLSFYTTTYDKPLDTGTGLHHWRQKVQELDGSITTYVYDVDGQLVDAERTGTGAYHVSYTYDGLGNRLRQDVTLEAVTSYTTYVYDKANQLLSSTHDGVLTTYTYDKNGNLTVRADAGNFTTFTWDEENRLLGVAYPTSPVSLTDNIYTADGLRQQKTTDDSITANQIGYVWDGQNVLQEIDGHGEAQKRYTDYPGQWGGLVSVKEPADVPRPNAARFNEPRFNEQRFNEGAKTNSHYYGFDPSDNTRQMVDGTGTVSSTITYLPFGEQIDTGGGINTATYASVGGRFGYQQDDERLRYVRARYLDVVTGRWLSRDPLGFEGGNINLYSNVSNDPIGNCDPSGLYVVLIRGGAGHDINAPDPMPELRKYIMNTYNEDVFTPTYFHTFAMYNLWINNPYALNMYGETGYYKPGLYREEAVKAYKNRNVEDAPLGSPPGPVIVEDVLKQIWQHLKRSRKAVAHNNSSDPYGLYLYGTSYGGHIVGQIANPPAGAAGHGIRAWKKRIARDFGVSFKRYVVSVVNASDYPEEFKYISANIYTLTGDSQLAATKGIWWPKEPPRHMFWFRPANYNSRGLNLEYDKWGLAPKPQQAYWFSGGRDTVAQLPIKQHAKTGAKIWVPEHYRAYPIFEHASFDARQGLSESPPSTKKNTKKKLGFRNPYQGYHNPYQDYIVRLVANRLMANHPYRSREY